MIKTNISTVQQTLHREKPTFDVPNPSKFVPVRGQLLCVDVICCFVVLNLFVSIGNLFRLSERGSKTFRSKKTLGCCWQFRNRILDRDLCHCTRDTVKNSNWKNKNVVWVSTLLTFPSVTHAHVPVHPHVIIVK